MKFKFKIQQYQTDAVERTVEVFAGQPSMDNLTYRRDLGKQAVHHQTSIYDAEIETGYRNSEVQLIPSELLANIRKVQAIGDIKLSDNIVPSIGACSLDIEMETGTGKTYVYIKTMFELNKRYGWSKFIVVVPSIAIREGLEVIDMRMSALADPIYEARRKFVEDIRPVVSQYYKDVSGGSELVGIEYDSELSKASLDMLLEASYEKDRIMKYTTSGIQRDDFIFTMNGHPIRRYGSQGQQKSFLVSLKFAQYEIMKRNYGFAPILLLDDVFDKLDMGRISNLLQMVASNDFGQIFITDSNKVRMSGIVDRLTQDRAYYETVSGTFTRL